MEDLPSIVRLKNSFSGKYKTQHVSVQMQFISIIEVITQLQLLCINLDPLSKLWHRSAEISLI